MAIKRSTTCSSTRFFYTALAPAQTVEHYEITRYGTLIAWAIMLGRSGLGVRPSTRPRRGKGNRKLNTMAARKKHDARIPDIDICSVHRRLHRCWVESIASLVVQNVILLLMPSAYGAGFRRWRRKKELGHSAISVAAQEGLVNSDRRLRSLRNG